MAVRLDSTDRLTRASYAAWDADAYDTLTVAGWVFMSTDLNAYSTIWTLGTAAGAGDNWLLLQTIANGTTLQISERDGSTTVEEGTVALTGTWQWIAVVKNGATIVVYEAEVGEAAAADTLNSTFHTSFPSGSTPNFSFGSSRSDASQEPFDGRLAHFKVWSAALTADELAQERWSGVPARTANLQFWWPFLDAADAVNEYTAGLDLSLTGTLATEDGPPVTWSPGRQRWWLPPAVTSVAYLRPDGDGTAVDWTGSWSAIDDDPDAPNEADYAQSTVGDDTNSVFYLLSDTPADFATATAVEVKFWAKGQDSTPLTLTAQLFKADESTAITNPNTVSITSATWGTLSCSLTITGTPTKADWDGARLKLSVAPT